MTAETEELRAMTAALPGSEVLTLDGLLRRRSIGQEDIDLPGRNKGSQRLRALPVELAPPENYRDRRSSCLDRFTEFLAQRR